MLHSEYHSLDWHFQTSFFRWQGRFKDYTTKISFQFRITKSNKNRNFLETLWLFRSK